jgi:hypothetical protein
MVLRIFKAEICMRRRAHGPAAPRIAQRVVILLLACAATVAIQPALRAERLPDNHWQLLAIAFPDDRDVEVILGGTEKTLISTGRAKVNWRDDVASVELEVSDLPGPAEAGWSGAQYVLWAVDSEKRVVNLGPVPVNGGEAKWKVQAPFRIFGLLVSAEANPQTDAPGSAVALESLLPTDPRLVVPVFRLKLALKP